MKLFKKKSVKTLTRTEALNCVPVKAPDIEEQRQPSGQVMLIYPVRVKPWLAGALSLFGSERSLTHKKKLALDELGTLTWDLMDNHRTVREVIEGFADKNRIHIQEAELAVSKFIYELGRRGLVGLK